MGFAINSCTFSGYLQRTPEYNTSANGARYARFTLRVDDSHYNAITNRYEDTLQFIDCLAFNDDADYLQENNACRGQKLMGTFRLRMNPKTITDSGTKEIRIISLPVFIVQHGQLSLFDSSSEPKKWHSSIWDAQDNM